MKTDFLIFLFQDAPQMSYRHRMRSLEPYVR